MLSVWKASKLREWLKQTALGNGVRLFKRNARIIKRHHSDPGSSIKDLLPGYFYLDYIEVVVTTRCNRNCSECANLMQHYKQPYDVDINVIKQSMKKLSECVDHIGMLRILGGEPLLYPYLVDVLKSVPLEKCSRIELVTNGTIYNIDQDTLEALKNVKASVYISNYPGTEYQQRKLCDILTNHGIKITMPQKDSWERRFEPFDHKRTRKQLVRQFSQCYLRCKSLLNGKVFYCPRSSHGTDLGICKPVSQWGGVECVDLLNNTKDQNRRQLRALMWRHKPVDACRFCLNGTDQTVHIPRGT